MTNSNLAASWQATAAYLYVLRLDAADLAWEYLRRDPRYRVCWCRADRRAAQAAAPWGLARLEDPALDALHAHPIWDVQLPALLHLRAAGSVRPTGDIADGMPTAGLDLWHIPGRKDLAVLPDGIALQARDGARCLRIRLDAGVLAGRPALCAVPLDVRVHTQAALLAAHAARFAPRRATAARPAPAIAVRVNQANLRHLRALQALDGVQAGASQRRIAEVLFGRERVRRDWYADSALRAQFRHSLARAFALMRGGYRDLAGLHPGRPGA